MTTVVNTKTERTLAEAEEAFAHDPERAEVIARARRFKSSWIELAEALTEIKRNGRWKSWGHASFEEYAKKELSLRGETADKLTGSFLFLKKSAPSVLNRDGVSSSIPSYQAIDFLRKAEEKSAPEEVMSEIRRRVIDEGAPLAQVSREYKDVVFPISKAERTENAKKGLQNVAKRLRELLDETKVAPSEISGDLKESLDRLLGWLSEEKEKAA